LERNRETLIALSLAKVKQDLKVSEASLRQIVIQAAPANPLPRTGIAYLSSQFRLDLAHDLGRFQKIGFEKRTRVGIERKKC
jgi:hypothetical protein